MEKIYNGDVKLKTDSNKWDSASTLPYVFAFGRAVVYNNDVHLLGGRHDYSENHYKYDGSSWTEVSTLPYDVIRSRAVVLNNEIHILGSSVDSGKTNKHYKYDGSNWVELDDLPYDLYDGSAVVYKDKIHILGSRDNYKNHYLAENYTKTIYYEDNGEW